MRRALFVAAVLAAVLPCAPIARAGVVIGGRLMHGSTGTAGELGGAMVPDRMAKPGEPVKHQMVSVNNRQRLIQNPPPQIRDRPL